MSSFLFGLLIVSWVVAAFWIRRQREKVEELAKACEKIQLEETRMFDFLHELGSAFSDNLRIEELHRLLVEAAMRVLDARGGALYIPNQQSAALIPSFVSENCPPLVAIPPSLREHFGQAGQAGQAGQDQALAALQSHLRSHPVEPGEGAIGTVWGQQEGLLLGEGDPRLFPGGRDGGARPSDPVPGTGSAMMIPLAYAEHRLGVLALANGPAGHAFDASDFAIFKAVAGQAAFALYSASIYSDAHEKRRLDQDLLIAQDIQRILLPSTAPHINGYEVCGINIPASRVSGDYYDYIRVDEETTGVVIADVSGKGVPASLIMAMCRSVLRSSAPGCASASEALHRVNRQLYPDIKEDMFISMAYVILDHHSNRVTLCRAGHDAPLLYSAASQTVSKINPPGMALGIDSGDVFDRIAGDFSLTLEKDDCLVLYTDGVTEALDVHGMEFGMKNMIQSIQASASGGAPAMIARLTDDLQTFIGTYPQNDDITLIVIRKT